ncbi:MAG: gliding motility-associated C-terminal domain-containing protein [Segetibacter sp.]
MHSQLCAGSLGDPIINITFGAGSDPGPVLNTTTNLQYVSYDCPNDGSYTVRNNTSQCFDNSWHILNSDHTGNANGYFMLINASLQKSEFYIDTVKGLCPGTTYEYAAWIMNVLLPSACAGNGINPNLTFNIEKTDGTILKTYSTGDITTTANPTWKQYGFFFATPADAGDVVVRISNNSVGGCGNDLAIDDITFRPCGAQLTPYIVGVQGDLKELCEGDDADVTLSCNISAGYNNPSYQWQQSTDNGNTYTDIPGANDTTFIKNITANAPLGKYLYRLSVANGTNINLPSCKVASSVLTINVNSKPVVNAVSNSPVCEGTQIVLTASGGLEYVWTGVNAFSASGASVTINNAKVADSGKYYVSITGAGGCRQTDSTVVEIIPGPVAATGFDSKTICQGDSVSLSSSGGTSYLWSPAADLSSSVIADPVAKPADTTLYIVVIQNETTCKDSATITINVIAKPKADAGPDRNILEGQAIQLIASADGTNNGFNWSPDSDISDIHSLQPIVNPKNDITYFLTVSSNNGCGISNDSVRVHIFKTVIIPNAFSPNGDGINDTWNIKALNSYNDYGLSVFNRYGQIVYTTKNYSKPWDGSFNGKPLPIGTYYYLVDLKQGLPKPNGFVVILR